MNVLIVGCGLTGATVGRQLAEAGHSVRIIEKREHIGGNVFDYTDKDTGIRLSKYGAHIFHTSSDRVWEYVNRFSEWLPYEHKVVSFVDGKYVPMPVNIRTVNELMGENIQTEQEMKAWLDSVSYKGEVTNSREAALARVGEELYELLFEPYTYKQWNKYPEELEPSVLERIPVRTDYNDRYFNDTYEGLPANGYTALVENMLDHENITVELNTPYDENMRTDLLVFTGKIDSYMGNKFGDLEYRSLKFDYFTVDAKEYQPTAVVNYPSLDYGYTRIVDYKQFYGTESDKSIIAMEYSTDKGEPYYPVPSESNRKLYQKYKEEAEWLESQGIYFAGRLAEYKYYNMDQAILSALQLADKLLDVRV